MLSSLPVPGAPTELRSWGGAWAITPGGGRRWGPRWAEPEVVGIVILRFHSSLGASGPITCAGRESLTPLEGIPRTRGGMTVFGKGKPDKEEWLREAERAYERVFGQRDKVRESTRFPTFTELEEEAVQEGNQLARWLLEGKISSETESSDFHREECDCPRCGRACKRKREELKVRDLRSRPGSVSFKRYEYYCVSCRKSFFPGGPQVETQG